MNASPAAENPFAARLDALVRKARRRRLDALLVSGAANVRALTGVACDSATLLVADGRPTLFTDFRYAPMVRRTAPWLKVRDIRRLDFAGARVGVEFAMSHACFEKLRKKHPRCAFVDVDDDVLALRAVKTADEIARLRAAEQLDCDLWNEARAAFRPGMTEREMARLIQTAMINRGEGEAFETIVCVGPNAAECHHVPDDTVWDGRAGVLVDMGVRLGGYCSDLTRNIPPKRPSRAYRAAYDLVREANLAAIAAVRPGVTAGSVDKVARDLIRKGGFGKCFGHSLGHGVGLDIHERPFARRGDKTVLEPGMLVTVEPGIYLEGDLGVRIEDLVLVTESGCEVLSASCEK